MAKGRALAAKIQVRNVQHLHPRLCQFIAIDWREIGHPLRAQLAIGQGIGIGATGRIGLQIDFYAANAAAQLRLQRHLHIVEADRHVRQATGMFIQHLRPLRG